jgi:hypothetical protein
MSRNTRQQGFDSEWAKIEAQMRVMQQDMEKEPSPPVQRTVVTPMRPPRTTGISAARAQQVLEMTPPPPPPIAATEEPDAVL